MGLFQRALEPVVFAPVELDFAVVEDGCLWTSQLSRDQVNDPRKPCFLVEANEVCLDQARSHQMNARQDYSQQVPHFLELYLNVLEGGYGTIGINHTAFQTVVVIFQARE
jgi:hypothetical protein